MTDWQKFFEHVRSYLNYLRVSGGIVHGRSVRLAGTDAPSGPLTPANEP